VVERKNILKLRSRTPSLLQDCASLPPLLGLTAESGLKRETAAGIDGKTYLLSLSMGAFWCHYLRQEPDAVILHIQIRAGGRP
ncbi:MAG: hypothetical protein WCH75_13725, partial [Candidatus Binatia bacterium]